MAQTFSLTALKLNGGSDNYVFTRGDRVVPVGGVEDGSWYRFTVRDPSGAILNPAFACTASSDFATNDHGYVIQPSDPLSTGGTYTFTLSKRSSAVDESISEWN